MAAKLNLLSDAECRSATSEGWDMRKLHDGGGLYLWVFADGRKYWRLRFAIDGSEKSLSPGVYPAISLGKARNRRDEERQRASKLLNDGRITGAVRDPATGAWDLSRLATASVRTGKRGPKLGAFDTKK